MNLQIKNIGEAFYRRIKALADSENRSISRQALLNLVVSWQDDRPPEEIVNDIKGDRLNSKKLSGGF